MECSPSGSCISSAGQKFLLGSRELFIRQHPGIMQVSELLQFSCQIRLGRRCHLWWGRGVLLGRSLLLMGL